AVLGYHLSVSVGPLVIPGRNGFHGPPVEEGTSAGRPEAGIRGATGRRCRALPTIRRSPVPGSVCRLVTWLPGASWWPCPELLLQPPSRRPERGRRRQPARPSA